MLKLRRIASVRQLKECADEGRQSLQRGETGFQLLAQLLLGPRREAADATILDFIPHLLVRVQFGRVGREKEQPELAVGRKGKILHRA